LLVKDIIKAHECCYFLNGVDNCTYCKECPLIEVDCGINCQKRLAELTVEKLKELSKLLEDTYQYCLIEELQEENRRLTTQIEKVQEILNG
jgi:hypothetical protein